MESGDKNLKIVSVAPVTKTIFSEDLTYFTTKEISLWATVLISLRGRDMIGIVTAISRAEEMKSELRNSEFNFKKIKKVLARSYLPEFVEMAKDASEYFVTPLGQLLAAVTPKSIVENWQRGSDDKAEIDHSKNSRFEISTLGLPDEDRYSFYKSLIREEFARRHSILFILPTVNDSEECYEILKKGIEDYAIIMHGSLAAKNILARWQRAREVCHPMLVVATPSFMSLPRKDIATIILDKSGSPFYKTVVRPFVDMRTIAEKLARKVSARLILGDSIPRVEEIYYAEVGNYVQDLPIKYRFVKNITQELVDTRKTDAEDAILSQKLKLALKKAADNKERVVIVCARKGLGTSTACSDCGEIISCKNCGGSAGGLPMIIRRVGNKNIFICTRCGEQSSTDVRCAKCGSWKLKVLGIATEGVVEEVRAILPTAKIFRLDGNIAKSPKQARAAISLFLKTAGGIMVGTEMVLAYLSQDVDNIFVASIDSLFSMPDFRMSESIFNLLTRLRLRSAKNFIIQTRRPEEKVFKYVMSGDLLEFYREDIKERKKLGYPPFKTLIKITGEGAGQSIGQEMEELVRFLKSYKPSRFGAFVERVNNENRINILLKVNSGEWPRQKNGELKTSQEMPYSNLLEILKSLPKRFVVKVDPENIL